MKLTVARVAPRDGRICAHCGATDGLSIQHRANKGMGGSAEREGLANGCILCVWFNVSLEQDSAAAHLAKRMGWKISKYDDPEKVPFWHAPTQGWRMAFNDGTWRPATADEVLDHLERIGTSE